MLSLLCGRHALRSGRVSHIKCALTGLHPAQVEVVEGDLECPESGHKFPISGGIPNLLLREDGKEDQSPKKQGTSHE